jgi:hypothetical protein
VVATWGMNSGNLTWGMNIMMLRHLTACNCISI